jgi:hypothetical protein
MRQAHRAPDHDLEPELKLTSFGLHRPDTAETWLSFTAASATADFTVNRLSEILPTLKKNGFCIPAFSLRPLAIWNLAQNVLYVTSSDSSHCRKAPCENDRTSVMTGKGRLKTIQRKTRKHLLWRRL